MRAHSPKEVAEVDFDSEVMGGPAQIRLTGLDRRLLESGAQAAITEIKRIEQAYSRYRHDSIVSRINAAAGTGKALAVDTECASLLDFAQTLYLQSNGLFDITSGVWRRVWDFRTARLPSTQTLAAIKPLVGWDQVAWDGHHIYLPHAGMELDFGGFGKEYAADCAAAVLIRHGIHAGFVNLAGDIRVLGPRLNGKAWQFGIQHPRRNSGLVANVALSHGALATSGDYERFFELDGKRYCHLLNPRSGMPVQHWQSISVRAPLCIAAGAMCTCGMLMGTAGAQWLRDQGASFLAVDPQGQTAMHEWS